MAGIAHVITPDSASGAQIIDGSLKFDSNGSDRLERTPSSDGSRTTFTYSLWIKRGKFGEMVLLDGREDDSNRTRLLIDAVNRMQFFTRLSNNDHSLLANAVRRDPSNFYHFVWSVDTTQSTASERVKMYVNGELQSLTGTDYPDEDESTFINKDVEHNIGAGQDSGGDEAFFDGSITQTYLIDGQALGPENFGFTDLLTNTWRPKKYEGTFGTNGFYLPLDGNSPIGEDKSGKGNNWTPVNFGGTVAFDNPQVSGARPILNTLPGGTQAGVGVFGSRENIGYAVTVAPKTGGGNAYYIDGVERQTLTGLIRGATYTFDQSDSSNDNHPLRLSITDDGTHTGGGAQYTNGNVQGGTPGTAGAATTITIPYNAPNTLYYYCGNHSGMGNNITGITTNEKLADQYASHCVLALPLVGANTDVSTSIACTSTTKSMSNVGNAAASSDTNNFYTGSFEFDGSGDGISTADNTDFEFGSGDFTVECWVKQDDTSGFDVFVGKYGGSSDGEFIVGKNGNTPTFFWQDSSGNANINATNFRGNTSDWYHIAGVREGDAFTLYVNGICENSTTDATTIQTTSNKLTIASEDSASDSPFDGYLQDVRIYKGVAKYSGTTVGTQYFIPPATSPDILPDTPSGVSGSSKLTKIVDGAVNFDGTGDFLGLANSTDTNFGSGDFTIECYAYFTSVSAETLLGQWENGSNRRSWLLQVNSGTLSSYLSADGTSSGMKRIDSTSGVIGVNRWYHLAYARSGDTMKMFIDGEEVGSVDVSGFTNYANTDDGFQVGSQTAAGANLMSGFISNARIIKGTGLYTSRFTPPTRALTNVTNTKLLCCQSPTSAIEGAVKPGTITANGDAVATTFNPFNTDINTVRGQETGYATWNPLANYGLTLANGNLDWQGGTNKRYCRSTLFADSGKWYCEFHMRSTSHVPGVIREDHKDAAGNLGELASSRFQSNGTIGYSGGDPVTGGLTWTVGDCVQLFMDMDNKAIYWGVNGTLKVGDDGNTGDPSSGASKTGAAIYGGMPSLTDRISEKAWGPAAGTPSANDTSVFSSVNFGQKPFKYAPPEGYQPWNTANVRPETVISRPDQFVGVTTYTGSNGTNHKITSGIDADLIWIKNRSGDFDHALYDTIRLYTGPDEVDGSSRALIPNKDDAQGNLGEIVVLNDGFNLLNAASSYNASYNYVAWSWKAGGSKNTFNIDDVGYASAAAAGLNSGTITPTGASVGTKQGFSIITYTGNYTDDASFSHGLGKIPKFVIVKATGQSTDWATYHSSLGLDSSMYLNSTDAATDQGTWGNTNPTTSLMYIANSSRTNSNTEPYIAYCWADVPGLQKFGTFEGNDNADGTFVELGFKPAIVWVKAMDSVTTVGGSAASSWGIWDSARMPNNPAGNPLFANLNTSETKRGNGSSNNTGGSDGNGLDGFLFIDMLSNGFKCRTGAAEINDSQTHIYCAWAEAPTVDLFGGGANAR